MRAARFVAVLGLSAIASAALWAQRVHLDPSRYAAIAGVDLIRHALPSAIYLHERLQQGELALWNPHQLAGQPFLALHITGALYPPNLLAMGLLEPARALEVLSVLHLALAGAFTWLLAARLGLGAPARLVATLGCMFSGPLLLGVYQFPCLLAHAWLPVILWAVHGLVCEARRRWAVALAVALAMCFLTGYAQGLFYALQIGAAFGLFGLARWTPRGARVRTAALAALGGVLALALVAPQLLPALELARESVRGLAGLSLNEAAFPFAQPALLGYGLLGPFGPEIPGMEWSPLRWRLALPLLALPLAAAGWLARQQREIWLFLVCTALAAALFILGPFTPVYAFAYSLPFGSVFRGPIRLAFFYVFLVSLLSAIGVQGIVERVRRVAGRGRAASAAGSLLVLGVAIDVYARSQLEIAHPAASAPIRGAPAELIDFLRSRPGRERVFVQAFGWYRVELLEKLGMMNGVFAVPDYESNMPAIYGRFLGGEQRRIWHGDLTLLEDARPEAPQTRPRTLDLLSVRYYAALQQGPNDLSARLRALAGGDQLFADGFDLFERPEALPRVYAVRRVRYEPSLESALRRVAAGGFEPHEEAVLVAASPRPRSGGAPNSDAVDTAEIVAYEPERVRIAAECGSECLLVLTDLHYPGWRVEVDGRPQTIERVNGILRGVWLEAGAHRVDYRYAPASFRLGLAILAVAGPGSALALWSLTPARTLPRTS